MKYYKVFGIAACVLIIVSCFLPWAYYNDIQEHFTGFYTKENMYGKPAKLFIFLAVVSAVLLLINKVWAKRTLLFLVAVQIAYLVKTYVLYTSCYAGNCPKKELGLYLLIGSVILLTIASLFPDTKLQEPPEKSYS